MPSKDSPPTRRVARRVGAGRVYRDFAHGSFFLLYICEYANQAAGQADCGPAKGAGGDGVGEGGGGACGNADGYGGSGLTAGSASGGESEGGGGDGYAAAEGCAAGGGDLP